MYLSMTLETLENSEKQVLLNFAFIPFKEIEKGSTENKWVKINLRLTNFLKIFLSFEDVM